MSTNVVDQWSTVSPLFGTTKNGMGWIPLEEQNRIAAYLKYDEMYWNDPRQYALRVLEGEDPIYIPNARTIVDTTAHYLLKGLHISCEDKTTNDILTQFLKREAFYSRFNNAKVAGVARGDFIFHLTANPSKAAGTRISLTPVQPMNVFPIWDQDEPGRMVGCHLATTYILPVEDDPEQKTRLRRLTYRLEEKDGKRRVSREEAIYTLEGTFFSDKLKLVKQVLPFGYLDERITAIPIYWFKNRHWDGEDYGSSELRGVERILSTVSQGATDVSGALALEGLGVYATDGGRPVQEVNGDITEGEWEVAPGKVMEVPAGSYFRRVEGIQSITPAKDNIDYLEGKMFDAVGLSDVALGKVEANVASSGIALAIRFQPTLAKIEARDQEGLDRLTQMFYDWKTWHEVFEMQHLSGDIVPTIGDKLPINTVAKINELNNMVDRKIISRSYYRQEMEKLGYVFPTDIETQISEDAMEAFKLAQQMASLTKPSDDSSSDEEEDESDTTLPEKGNRSNNRQRPNESGGTEAKQKSTRDS